MKRLNWGKIGLSWEKIGLSWEKIGKIINIFISILFLFFCAFNHIFP
tara:strand:- start:73 stop:213 length:141 start_codon:yes stop_codon:yes gene_type:complete